ncbi:N-acetylgalactosamine-6-sulfatase [Pilimelia anulata]|uniref:N-acetylgalactosamine-6-sulfatase n=1 Tax=Pilimelia anulata TaxID=53371 RepID=A0A8J3BAX6_9ACTN|nr:sulfatase-like hydrolase/transferase [Pilimelia anulata]GGK08093.1 N-acetylgalactosamine-6-sulfatase [Pilimelia anulata]
MGRVEQGGGTGRRAVLAGLLGAAGGTALAGGPAFAGHPDERPFRARPGTAPTRPNLLVILGDDLGWADLSAYGAPQIRTPHLDALARSGVRFTNGYSAAAVCSPTRFALYTGRYPGRLRGGLPEPIANPNELEGLPPGHPTLASLVKGAGYRTALLGKWHAGFLPWFGPLRSGWDEFFGNLSGGLDYYSKLSHLGQHDLYEGEVPVESVGYYTDTVAQRAVDFVRREHAAPWLLNLNFTSPHWPWEAPGDTAVSAELTARIRAGEKGVLFHADGGSLETYRAMVENLDAGIGRVLAALRATGQERNTVVFFASDNGGERFSYQWPLSGGKGGLNEGGIRVPTLLSWPAAIAAGQVSHEPVITQDWTATLLAFAGAAPAAGHPLDGRDLSGYLLRGDAAPAGDLFWRTRGARALRRGNLKYLRATPTTGDALYDIAADPREAANLAAKRPEVVAALRATWERIDADLLPYP